MNAKLPPINLRTKALTYLARREYTKKEMVNKLELICDDRVSINKTVEQLVQHNYLSETRYIESYIQSKINKYSLNKIRYQLMQKIDDYELINKFLQQFANHDINLARHIIKKKFGQVGDCLTVTLKTKIYRYLSSKGFSYEVIKQALAN
ncbi:MAG: hypothetical protein RL017_196 [Pseudomonadota bacterium]|nr:regulatory protein RecX [Burkholderiales bacterium]